MRSLLSRRTVFGRLRQRSVDLFERLWWKWRRRFRRSTRMTGVVKRIVREKGFGFNQDERGKEYFFHATALKNVRWDDLEVGREVTFEDAEGTKGPRAEDIFV